MKHIEEKARFFRALGEPNRLRIVQYLLKKGKCTCICELSRLLKRDQSVVFRHISILKDASIIKTDKQGQSLMCCIRDTEKIKKLLR